MIDWTAAGPAAHSIMYRSSSASVLPTPRRTASRSPQRQYHVPPTVSTSEHDQLQQKRDAFKKRMTYDASKSAAMGRTAAGRRSDRFQPPRNT